MEHGGGIPYRSGDCDEAANRYRVESPGNGRRDAYYSNTSCDAGTCTATTAQTWATAANKGFGYTCYNQVNSDVVPEDVWTTTTDTEMERLLDAIRNDQPLRYAFQEVHCEPTSSSVLNSLGSKPC